VTASPSNAESPLGEVDRQAIVAVATEYILSWLDDDADRLVQCIHPDLAKRMVDSRGAPGRAAIVDLGANQLVEGVAAGLGNAYDRTVEVDILDAYPPIASVMVRSVPFVEYLHLARFDERWLVLNVVWQRRPGFIQPR